MSVTRVLNIDRSIQSLEKNGKPFRLNETTLTAELICRYGVFKWAKNSNLKNNELAFIRQLSNYGKKLIQPQNIDKSKIRYIDISRKFQTISDCWEIDLNSAYWEIAYKDGYLTEEIYNKGKTVSKFARLVALGNLAKVIYHLNFDGKEYNFEGTTETETANIFFNSCLKTSEIMQKLKYLTFDDFLFFWVDAIFVKSEDAKNRVENYLEGFDIPFKIRKIDKIVSTNKVYEVFSADKPKPRIFTKLSDNSRTPINVIYGFKKNQLALQRAQTQFKNPTEQKINETL